MEGLRPSEVHWVIGDYIGVSGGYLGDFTYATHREFYAAYCDLSLDAESFPGKTTKERFIAILGSVEARDQAAILLGIARRFPVGSEVQRTAMAQQRLLALAKRCKAVAAVDGTSAPVISSDTVQRAIAEANTLLTSHGPASAIDRVHTALHGYLRTVCRKHEIDTSSLPADPRIIHYFKTLRAQHPQLRDLGVQDEAVRSIFHALGNIIDQLDPIRNRGSLAHANETLVERDEALLVINATRAVMQYLDAKLRTPF